MISIERGQKPLNEADYVVDPTHSCEHHEEKDLNDGQADCCCPIFDCWEDKKISDHNEHEDPKETLIKPPILLGLKVLRNLRQSVIFLSRLSGRAKVSAKSALLIRH